MNSKQRFLTALERKVPGRLPVTTHHVMPYFLEHTMDGISFYLLGELDHQKAEALRSFFRSRH